MRKTITAIIAAATTAIMIGGAGMAAASARPAAATAEHFQEMVASPTSNQAHVIAYGAFTAAGVDTQHNNNTDTFSSPAAASSSRPRSPASTSISTQRRACSQQP